MPKNNISIPNLILVTSLMMSLTPAYAKSKVVDSDGDGLADSYEIKIGTEPFLADTDGDGLSDGFEVGKNFSKPLNHDGDRLIDARDADDDNDGLPTILELQSNLKLDPDNDHIKNYLDPDSDNDGINDGIEAGIANKDSDNDYIDDSFDADNLGDPDKNGDGIADTIVLPDHNNDGIPDMLDKAYQYGALRVTKKNKVNKKKALLKTESVKTRLVKSAKLVEKVKSKASSKDKKAKPLTVVKSSTVQSKSAKIDDITSIKLNKYTDSDNDGLQDSLEKILGTDPNKRDSDGDKVSDAIEIGFNVKKPQDSDHDGIIDALDVDDDNDGILSADEDVNKDSSPINDDTDEDGVPNYLDANDDGDDKLTITEGGFKDTDKDGILDYLDKNDGVKDTPIVTTAKALPTEPEVVVLSEPSEDDLSEQSLEPVSNRTINALEQAISKNKLNDKSEQNHFASSSQGKLSNKKQVSLQHSLTKDDGGIISWLKKLF